MFSSWWCWWYGGSLGMRSMIEFYGFMAFPLGALIVYSKNWLKPIIVSLAVFFALYNLVITKQYKSYMLHWDSSSKATFWQNFLRIKYDDQADVDLYEDNLIHPDYENALEGKEERVLKGKQE